MNGSLTIREGQFEQEIEYKGCKEPAVFLHEASKEVYEWKL